MSMKTVFLGAVALLAALFAGFGLARLTQSSAPVVPAAHMDEGASHDHDVEGEEHAHDDDAHEDAIVILTAEQIFAAGIVTAQVTRGGGLETRLSGRVEARPDARAVVTAKLSGAVQGILVAPGDSVAAGASLMRIASGDGAAIAADASAADAEAQAASLVLDRERRLLAQGVVAQQDFEAAQARATAAQAQARAAHARAVAAGAPAADGGVVVTAPLSGVVSELNVSPGGFVQQGEALAIVADPDAVELVFHAPAELAGGVRAGDEIRARLTGGREVVAHIVGVAPAARAETGAMQIRARVDGESLPIGAAAAGVIITDDMGALSVPATAVQTLGGQSVVFVLTDDGFRAAPVLAGRQASGRIEILSGLDGTERIAGTNAFLLKAELSKGEAGHDH